MPDLEGALGVFGEENLLNGHFLRLVAAHDFHQGAENAVDPFVKGSGAGDLNLPGVHAMNPAFRFFHEPVSGDQGAGIHSQHKHQPMASITSSGMSKLAYMLLTSSLSSSASIKLSICWACLPSSLTVF